jgi:Na+/H+-dicarboxylate symporter
MEQATDQKKPFIPFYAQILIAVFFACLAGIFFGKESTHYWANDSLSEIGLSVIRLLKILAIPLILFAIVDTILKTEITGKNALKVVGICLFNVSVAMLIGLVILNVFEPGKHWKGRLETPAIAQQEIKPQQHKASLDPIKVLTGLVPESIVEPFLKNNTMGVIIVALLFGFAFKSMRKRGETEHIDNIEKLNETLFKTTLTVIGYIIKIIPYAVFCLVGAAVGKSGLAVFSVLWIFLLTILAGFFVHAFIYYPLVAWLIGKKSPRIYFGKGADTIITAFSVNSSLATMPMTLKTLTQRMGVSETSARMSACFATNLNNDGITLYEAMTALFLTQALGFNLPLPTQMFIVLVSIFVSMGIAGIPEAGLIILPLVLGASGLSDQTIGIAIAMIVPIDWFIARLRSAINVMSDMAVAIILDKV